VLAVACTTKPASKASRYYAVDSLLTVQVRHLTQSAASLTKTAVVGAQSETKTYTPKFDTASTAWKHELDAFFQLHDINKPSNAGKYTVVTNEQDRTSNLLVYSLTTTEDVPVAYYKVYYLNTLSNIRKIEAFYAEESVLLNSARKLTLEFQDIHNKIVLTSYSIVGGQKMLLADSVTFSVNGSITFP
jgi:hypothetical protein